MPSSSRDAGYYVDESPSHSRALVPVSRASGSQHSSRRSSASKHDNAGRRADVNVLAPIAEHGAYSSSRAVSSLTPTSSSRHGGSRRESSRQEGSRQSGSSSSRQGGSSSRYSGSSRDYGSYAPSTSRSSRDSGTSTRDSSSRGTLMPYSSRTITPSRDTSSRDVAPRHGGSSSQSGTAVASSVRVSGNAIQVTTHILIR